MSWAVCNSVTMMSHLNPNPKIKRKQKANIKYKTIKKKKKIKSNVHNSDTIRLTCYYYTI